jgi:uncharacterized cupredoxin-like copper-binding protein
MKYPPARYLALLWALLLIGCGATAGQEPPPGLVVTATEFRFNPSALTLKAGEPAELTLKNSGQTLHDFALVSGPGIPTPAAHANGTDPQHSDGSSYHVAAQAGTQATLKLTLPPGSYTFICTVQGHADLGMRGTLAVQ